MRQHRCLTTETASKEVKSYSSWTAWAATSVAAHAAEPLCRAHQAYPTKGELAEAFKGRLFATGKKKMSRLKRIILRERANKAFADASASLESAAAAARLAAALRDNIREQHRVHMAPCLIHTTHS